MLDHFSIFTLGGSVLWEYEWNALVGSPINALVEQCPSLLGAGVRVSYPNASSTAEERAAGQAAFESELTKLDAAVAEGGGPFLGGAAFSLADAMYIPMLERWAVQLPLTTGLRLRPAGEDEDGPASPPRWPALARWLDAMEA